MAAEAAVVGCQTPTLRICPDYSRTFGPSALATGAEFGYGLDPWQQNVLMDGLAINDADGMWAAQTVMEVVSRQNGKACAVDTPILTTEGFVLMGDVRVGMRVFSPSGDPVDVIDVSDVLVGRDCYRVTSTDGRSVVVDGQHLWTVQGPSGAWQTMTTAELVDAGVSSPRVHVGGRVSTVHHYRLPVVEPLRSAPVDLPLDPYVLGQWLGNGSRGAGAITCHSQDAEHLVKQVEAANLTVHSVIPHATALSTRVTVARLRSRLAALGVLEAKTIPAEYLAAGLEQRLSLLQGLMDSDGYCALSGQCEFVSIDRALADGVLFLVRSLGWRARIVDHPATLNGREVSRKYRILWTPDADDLCPFRLRRKAARIVKHSTPMERRRQARIATIKSVPSVPVRCISVGAFDGLYLAGSDLMPTHNSLALEVLMLWALFVARKRHIVYTAHQAQTAKKIFERLQRAIERNPDFADELMPDRSGGIRIANGEWQITLATGAYIAFRTRTPAAGRGLDDVDLLIIDEVQDYTDAHQQVLQPIISANANPQIWYAGSAGGQHSAPMARLVRRAEKGEAGIVYHGWHASEEDDPYSEETIAKTNPAYGVRLLPETVESEKDMTRSAWMRERIGIADYPRPEGEDWVIPKAGFERVNDPDASIAGSLLVLVPEATPDLAWASISVAGRASDQRVVMELLEHDRGSKWLRPILKEIKARQEQDGARVVIAVDPKSPASFVIDELKQDNITITEITHEHLADAFAWLTREAPEDPPEGWSSTIAVRSAKEITQALAAAKVRKLGSRWTWQRHTADDVTPIISADLAGWMLLAAEREKTDPPPSPQTARSAGVTPRRRNPRSLATQSF